MPYIEARRRMDFGDLSNCAEPENAGELNFFLTSLVIQYLFRNEESYQKYNEVIGVLECCKQELYRKMISKYEDKKCVENGEVYYVR